MKFSIIVPVYNAEEYLVECIESILRQTYRCDELILVDDGSTDGSRAVCTRYAEQYPEQIRVIFQENSGPMKARWQGVKRAKGDIILFMDADDCLRKDALEIIHTGYERTGCDVVLFNASQDNRFQTQYRNVPFANEQCFSGEEKKELLKTVITTSKLNSLVLKAIKKELIQSLETVDYSRRIKHGEDLLQSLPLITKAKKICYLDENLYYYRSRPDSIVHTYDPARHHSIRYVHREMEKYIDLWGMQEYHPQHYAREVRGWVDCLKELLKHQAPGAEKQKLLRELAEDAYFRNAYGRMAAACLSRKETVLARWLYQKKYGRLLLIGRIIRLIRQYA